MPEVLTEEEQILIADKGNTVSRIHVQFNERLEAGITVNLGFKKEMSLGTLGNMTVQLDVLSLDSANDASGYSILDVDNGLHTGISKADFESTILELKIGAMQLFQQKAMLLAQVDSCTTKAELDALVFV